MNFEFSDEQKLLKDQASGFLKENCPLVSVRDIVDDDALSYDKTLWAKIGEMGWTSTTIPEEYGGLGCSYLELSVIAEELGRSLAPTPFSSSVYLATEAINVAGSDQQKNTWLPKLATGEIIGCVAVAEAKGQITPASLATESNGSTLSGTKIPVADGDVADFSIVFVRANIGDGASAYIVDLTQSNVERESIRTLDPSRSQAKITFTDANCELLGKEGEGWSLLQKINNTAAVLFAWEQVGGSEHCLEMAKAYALDRIAFGRPIASYQAIKHKLANVYVKNTIAKSNCYYGAWALSTNDKELPVAAASARISAIQAYYFASKENIQVHGGMGFTWEFDCQFFYRRSKQLAVNIGSELVWQDKLISAIELDRAS
ncbi:MAG: acyl-CoA/acyl-ACP dehydrogenase [Pseudomonadales bacterium]|nr:acyl-CoA/acyl-ACP dehydrogenase [Pseudomonadales bacterium]